MILIGMAMVEKHDTLTQEEIVKFVRLFITQTINMTIVIFIANFGFNDIPAFAFIHENIPGGRYFFNGDHPEFTRFWYVKVGMSILVLKAINIVWPQILALIFMVPVCNARRICCAHKTIFQFEMNNYYDKLNINLWDRYASTLSNFFFALVFCSGIPLLLPLIGLFFLAQYWLDKVLCKNSTKIKILVIKYARRPPPYDVQLNSLAFRILPYGIVAHLFISIFVYTCPQIYPLAIVDDYMKINDTRTLIYKGRDLTFADRVSYFYFKNRF